ncbi:hypothetical protein BC829DRAFT_46728 [Chytridium lagenaria]|nr:hypothetical protein BC829DRAFT_46728 [Chytridium lagenaria]
MKYWDRLYPLQLWNMVARQTVLKTSPPIPVKDADMQVLQLLKSTQAGKERGNWPKAFLDNHGFHLFITKSNLPKAGRGVFVNGRILQGTVVAFYPGTTYEPHHPLLFVSIRNHYLMRLKHGGYVDGKGMGLSASIYKSIKARKEHHCDASWMLHCTSEYNLHPQGHPLGIGHIINNGSNNSNVAYFEIDLDDNMGGQGHWIPNISYCAIDEPHQPIVKTAVLVTTRDVENGEELLSTYRQVM